MEPFWSPPARPGPLRLGGAYKVGTFGPFRPFWPNGSKRVKKQGKNPVFHPFFRSRTGVIRYPLLLTPLYSEVVRTRSGPVSFQNRNSFLEHSSLSLDTFAQNPKKPEKTGFWSTFGDPFLSLPARPGPLRLGGAYKVGTFGPFRPEGSRGLKKGSQKPGFSTCFPVLKIQASKHGTFEKE